MSRSQGYLFAVGLLVVGALIGAGFIALAPEPEQVEPPSRVPYVESVALIRDSGSIPLFASGTVRPSAEITVTTELTGRVIWVNPEFKSGRKVNQGETLFRIDDTDYLFRSIEAEVAVIARKAEFLRTEEEAKAARAEYQRFSERTESEATPEQINPLAVWEPQLSAATAALRREETRYDEARLAVQRTRIVAPFDSYIREENVAVGQYVIPGQVLGSLFASDAVEVVVPLSDDDAALIPGLWANDRDPSQSKASAVISASYGHAEYAWQGFVERVESALDPQSRTIDVILQVSNPFHPGVAINSEPALSEGPPLLIGKFVDVEIEGRRIEEFFRVPRAVLKPQNRLWLVDPVGTVRIVDVTVLHHGDDEIFVTGDLQPNDRAVISGISFATEGMVVQTQMTSG